MDAMKLLLAGLVLGLGINIAVENHEGNRNESNPSSLQDPQDRIQYNIEGLEGGYKPKNERFELMSEDDE